jgi:hypothetical protein
MLRRQRYVKMLKGDLTYFIVIRTSKATAWQQKQVLLGDQPCQSGVPVRSLETAPAFHYQGQIVREELIKNTLL